MARGRFYSNNYSYYNDRQPWKQYSSHRPASSTPRTKSLAESMKVPELKKELKKRGLKVSGVKAELVKRLEDHLAQEREDAVAVAAVAAAEAALSLRARYDGDRNIVGMNPGNANHSSAAFGSHPPHVPPINNASTSASNAENDRAVFDGAFAMAASYKPEPLARSVTMSQDSADNEPPFNQPQPEPFYSKSGDAGSSSILSPEQRARMEGNRMAAQNKRQAPAALTEEQKARIEQKRLEALERKSRLSNTPIKKVKREPAGNPYLRRSTGNMNNFNNSAISSEDHLKSIKENYNNKQKQKDNLPLIPLPDDAPPIREATLNMLSEQQLKVIELARPPTVVTSVDPNNGNKENIGESPPQHMVRVTAAAGTGKTTTLLHLAVRCSDLGHKELTYITFTKASAKDAKERIEAMGNVTVNSSTVHSCAMRILADESADSNFDEEKGIMNENKFKQLIQEIWGDDVEKYLLPAYDHIRKTVKQPKKIAEMEKLVQDKAMYYLYKTFRNFCIKKMSLEDLKNEHNEYRHYFPVKKQFNEGGDAAKLGFPPERYSMLWSYKFYADKAAEMWEYFIQNDVRTFDIEMKKAQLKKVRIPCSVLLVDECQDLDACQVDFIDNQKQFGTHIFFVGDAAQSIYCFRGAQSKHVMSLKCHDTELTNSWRFGPSIARIANIALFAKSHSPQTSGNKNLWKKYFVTGAGSDEGALVTTKPILDQWRTKRVTLIGTTNAGLMLKAMDMMGLGSLKNPDDDQSKLEDKSDGSTIIQPSPAFFSPEDTPKFHINGKGETSGLKKWRKAVKQTSALFELYMSKDEEGYHPCSIPLEDFPDFFRDGPVTWPQFLEICQVREINTYAQSVQIIAAYGQNTPKAMEAFESQCLSKSHSPEQADIILTTCHSAKGLEWDHVQVCDDFLDLNTAAFTCDRKKCEGLSFPTGSSNGDTETKPRKMFRDGWQFCLSDFSDDINVLYVALTRARKSLSVPESIKRLMQQFDMIHNVVLNFKPGAKSEEETMIVVKQGKLNKGEVWNLYNDLCSKLREDLGAEETCKITKHLFPHDGDLDSDGDVEVKDEDDESETNVEC